VSQHRFPLDWAGKPWLLRLDAPIPGLYPADLTLGPVLGLEAIAAVGRPLAPIFASTPPSVIEHDPRRTTASYAPPAWGSLRLTATWTHTDPATIDLDLEVQTRDFERLRGFEWIILSRLGDDPPPGAHRSVSPRDPRSAGYSYDGRDPNLNALVTGPPGEPIGPWLAPQSGRDGWTYVEMVHPVDVSRRIHEGTLPFRVTRTALLGHDLERGVILRARMRGLWLPKSQAHSASLPAWQAFLDRPLPLST
jgi:hypothetical protein